MDTAITPYRGPEKYVFVSYSHTDEIEVSRELHWLDNNGIRLWFDEGIDPGTDWRDEIGEAILGSTICLYFVSPKSAASPHCQREVKFALDNEISVVPVYLSSTDLPPGIAMSFSGVQHIEKYASSATNYEARLISALREALELADTTTPKPHRPVRRTWMVLAGVAVLVVAAALLVTYQPFTSREPQPETARLIESGAIAVLPFDLAGNNDDNFVHDGFAEEIINKLVASNSMPVVARSSSFQYRDAGLAIPVIAKQLAVRYIISGSIRKQEEVLRISIHLNDGQTGTAIWADEFDRPAQALFQSQDDVAAIVVNRILTLTSAGKSVAPTERVISDLAYRLYREALALDTRIPQNNQHAIRLLKEVTELAPSFANAWVELAFASWNGTATPRVKKEQVKALLDRALEIDPENGRALALLGTIVARCDYEWEKGMQLIQRAVANDPFDAEVVALYSFHLGSIHHPEAPEASLEAYRLDPLNANAVEDYARSLLILGRQKDSLAVWENYLATRQGPATDEGKVDALTSLGRIDEATAELTLLTRELGQNHPVILSLRHRVLISTRDFERAGQLETELIRRSQNEDIPFIFGSPQTLDERIANAIEQRNPQVVFLLVGPKPRPIPPEHWSEFRKTTKVADIQSPIVFNYRARTDEEITALLGTDRPIDPQVLVMLSGRYIAEGFRDLVFSTSDGNLEIASPAPRLVHTGELEFELVGVRGYRYRFDGDGNLRATDGQLERQYRKVSSD